MFKFLVAMIVLAAVNAESSTTEAPSVCPENQHYALCGNLCEPNCFVPKPLNILCPRIVCTLFSAGCRCNKGYVRNFDNGECILEKDCPPQQ